MHYDFGDYPRSDDFPQPPETSNHWPMTVSVLNVTCEECLDGYYGDGLTVRQAKERLAEEEQTT